MILQSKEYFAHADDLVFSMLFDKHQDVTELTLRSLLKARDGQEKDERRCLLPNTQLCVEATYHLLTGEQEAQLTEAPLTKGYLKIESRE